MQRTASAPRKKLVERRAEMKSASALLYAALFMMSSGGWLTVSRLELALARLKAC